MPRSEPVTVKKEDGFGVIFKDGSAIVGITEEEARRDAKEKGGTPVKLNGGGPLN